MSTETDFQNGFVCGMATKGLVRSGELYKPTIWNDSGIYTYFYIDFRRVMAPFSLGMFTESIIVYDSATIYPSTVELVSGSTYKVYCNFSDKIRGVTVINKRSTLLSFASGRLMPAFSTMFFVAGLDTYVQKAYGYSIANIGDFVPSIGITAIAIDDVLYTPNFEDDLLMHEYYNFPSFSALMPVAEYPVISYWST